MEMTYDGALVMPSSCALMDEDEMRYVEGGWSWKTLGKSLKNLYNAFSFASRALKLGGITLGAIAKMTSGVAAVAYSKIASVLGSIAAANWVVGLVIGVSAAAAIWTMGTWVCF